MSIPDLLDEEYKKISKESDLMFGHPTNLLPLVDMEDESFTNWYRKNAGMHTVETWLSNYKRHPYAWGALIMIHGVNEVSARLRSKVENYAVYSAVLLSASVVLFAMTEINPYFEDAHWLTKRIYLYAMCISVASHLTSILLSMSFVNALNEASRDADVIRMFGEGQGFLATHKCGRAFQHGLIALGVAIIDMIFINFDWIDGLLCAAITISIMWKLKSTSFKLFSSSSLVEYWRWGVGKSGEIGSRAVENEDPFDLRIPLERISMKSKISTRLYRMIKGEDIMDEETKAQLEFEHAETDFRKQLMSPSRRRTLLKNNSCKNGSFESEDGIDQKIDQDKLEKGLAEELVLLAHEDGLQTVDFNRFGSPMGPTSMAS